MEYQDSAGNPREIDTDEDLLDPFGDKRYTARLEAENKRLRDYATASDAFLDDLDARYEIKSIDAYTCPLVRAMAEARQALAREGEGGE